MIYFTDFIGPGRIRNFPEETSHQPLMEICQRDCAADKLLTYERRKTKNKSSKNRVENMDEFYVLVFAVEVVIFYIFPPV